jgi:hypothetical protein
MQCLLIGDGALAVQHQANCHVTNAGLDHFRAQRFQKHVGASSARAALSRAPTLASPPLRTHT